VLSFIVFFPLLGVAIIALLPKERERDSKWVAAGTAFVVLVAAVGLFVAFDRDQTGFQFVQSHTWISGDIAHFDIQYLLGVDGLGLAMLVLTALLGLVAVLISWNIELRPKEYFVWLLLLEMSLLGVFTALDFLLFFIFWEIELIPMYFLISIWGTGRKVYSAWKYVFFTFFGSAFMLVGLLVLGFAADTFDIRVLSQMEIHDALVPTQVLFFLLIFGFAIKLPVFPFHTWLPDAHTDAPTAVSVMLAGVLLKMGGYGMLRICLSILPDVARDAAVWLAVFGVVNILYGALVTLVQTDLKRLIAYSSISHMGYVLLGLSALGQVGLTGAGMQMFTHGVITGLLFVMVGMVYDRAHTRQIGELSGLAHQMPMIAVVMVIAGLASLGLPSMAGFVSEMMVFLGAFDKHGVLTILGVIGILLTAGYILWMIQRVFLGERLPRWDGLGDATAWWERTAMIAMVAVIFLVGIYPAVVADIISTGVEPIVGRLA
jgi:NADH-quinone oxidoreductase subunit M